METIKLNSKGVDVLFLQKHLGIKADGIFGVKTEEAVKCYQNKHNLVADGIVGNKTWSTFKVSKLVEDDYVEASILLDCDIASIKAITSVESGGKGFIDTIRPIILFEGHIFYKNTSLALYYSIRYPNICYKKWDKSKYKGGNGEYTRLSQAWKLNVTAALKSASIGLFQIMGDNYKLCGYDSVQDMWADACMGEREQLIQFCNFLKSSGIDKPLRNHDWGQVARLYNGPEYAKNNYDIYLRLAYEKYNKL